MAIPPKPDDSVLMDAFTPIIHRHGLVCESVLAQRVGGTVRLVVTVDLPEDEIGSADLDTVTDVSEEISQLLDDDLSLIGDVPSTLDVTTPGVFRPLDSVRAFKRSRSRLLSGSLTDGRTFYGRLTDVVDDELVLDVQKPPHDPKRKKKGAAAPAAEKLKPGEHRVPITEVETVEIQLEFR